MLAAQIIISSLEIVQAVNYHPVYINYIISTVNQKSLDIGHCGEIINIWMSMDNQHYLLHLPDLDHDGAAYIYVNYGLI